MENFFKKVENIFLIICLIVGLIFIIINPPFQVSDENSHFYKMYSISEGSFNFKKLTVENGKTYAASVLPVSVILVARDANSFIGKYDKKYSIDYIKTLSKMKLEKTQTATLTYFVPSYGILSYVPGIAVLELMKIFNVPPLWMMYVLRIVLLLTYTLICYFAIKIVPAKKWFFMMCALLPISVYSAGGISTDGLVTALCFLYTAYIFNLAFNENVKVISKKDILISLLLILYITVCKFPYGALALLLFVIPKEKFPKILSRCKTFWMTTIVLIIYVLLNYLYYSSLTKGLSSPNHNIVSSQEAFTFAIKNPLQVFSTLVNTVKLCSAGWYIGTEALFGWSDTKIPLFFYPAISIMLILSSLFNDKDENSIGMSLLKNKIIYFGISFLFTLITLAVCYLLFSDAHFDTIYNMQGRYLVPIIPLIYLIFSSKIKINYVPLKIFSLIFYVVLIISCCMNIVTRFY